MSFSWFWKKVFGNGHQGDDDQVEVIAIGGATRSGKGTLATALAKGLNLPEWAVVHCDEFFDAERIFVQHIEALKKVAAGEAYLASCAGDAQLITEARAFAAAGPGTVEIPCALRTFVATQLPGASSVPGLCWSDWEAPEAMDWGACAEAVGAAVARAREAGVHTVIVEGYTLLQRTWPLAPAVPHCSRALFLAVPRTVACARRMATKRVPQEYFDARVWPEHLSAHTHLLRCFGDDEEGREWLEQHGGDLLVLDGTTSPDAIAQTALRFVQHDAALAARDRTCEHQLLEQVLK